MEVGRASEGGSTGAGTTGWGQGIGDSFRLAVAETRIQSASREVVETSRYALGIPEDRKRARMARLNIRPLAIHRVRWQAVCWVPGVLQHSTEEMVVQGGFNPRTTGCRPPAGHNLS